MKTTLWGVRGSISTHSGHTTRYGGNTACIENVFDNGYRVILDAGTGMRSLGMALSAANFNENNKSCAIFLSHGHWDHIVGLPFFSPLYDPDWDITICGPADMCGVSLESLITNLFSPASFPVSWDKLPRRPRIVPMVAGESIYLDMGELHAHATRHGVGGNGALSCTIEADNTRVFYSGDHELTLTLDPDDPVLTAMRGVEVAIVDAQYTMEDYVRKQGWGHSALEQWPPLALEYGVEHMLLTHFDPSYTDGLLDKMALRLNEDFPYAADRVVLAHEGLEICAHSVHATESFVFPMPEECHNCAFSRELFEYSDVSMIFDSLLTEARRQTHADAGTIYLYEEGRLLFSYAQNDTLFSTSQTARQQYLTASLPVDNTSIAGYAAMHDTVLNIDDVYQLPSDVPYRFNPSFDKATGYRTRSVCAVPLRSMENELVGVVQLINCTRDNEVIPFSTPLVQHVESLGTMGAQAIERAHMVRDMILRMLRTSALRDPTETAGHVMRVGAMAAEIYHRWAENRGIGSKELLNTKSHIRMAAMLHDVGKVGIADAVLKKPGRLNPCERREMEKHCALGASLFSNATWELDMMAKDIALHHHQRWDGSGYTGDPEIPTLAAEEIPLGARITAIADVFDALVSRRCYKEAWNVEDAFETIQNDSGTHFDPEAVSAFLEIRDTIVAIKNKYQG